MGATSGGHSEKDASAHKVRERRLAILLRLALDGNTPSAKEVGDVWPSGSELADAFCEFADLEPFDGSRGRIEGQPREIAKQRIARLLSAWLAAHEEEPPAGLSLDAKKIAIMLYLAAEVADRGRVDIPLTVELTSSDEKYSWTVGRESVRKTRAKATEVLARFLLESPRRVQRPRISGSLPVASTNVIGRAADVDAVAAVLTAPSVRIVEIASVGGAGKTTLADEILADEKVGSVFPQVFVYSFYRPAAESGLVSGDQAVETCLQFLGESEYESESPYLRGGRLARAVAAAGALVVLDGLEPLQHQDVVRRGVPRDPGIAGFLNELRRLEAGACLVTSRISMARAYGYSQTFSSFELDGLDPVSGASLLRSVGVLGSEEHLQVASAEAGGHPLTLTLLGVLLRVAHGGDVRRRWEVLGHLGDYPGSEDHLHHVMQSYDEWLRSRQEEPLLHLLCAFDGSIDDLLLERVISTLDSPAVGHAVQSGAMSSLEDLRLVSTFQTGGVPYRELHPLVRTYFRAKLQRADSELWRSVNLAIARTLESLPASWRPGAMDEISMLYQAAAHYCRADNRQHAWRVIYQDRLMHGTEHFAVELRGALSSTVSLLGELLPERSDDGGTDLTDPDLLDLLIDAGTYMSAMFSYADPGAGACYRDGIALASALDVPSSRLVCSLGAARHARFNGRLDQALEITADELSRIANSPVGDRADDPHASLLSCLYREHCSTLFFLGRIEECRIFAALGAGLDVAIHEQATEMARILVNDPVQSCEGYLALCDSRDGDHEAAGHRVDRVLATLETQPHPHTEAVILLIACMVEENAGHADRVAFFADRMRILSTDRGFGQWAIAAEIFSVWAGAIIGNSLEPPSAISDLVDRWRLSGSWLFVPYFLHLQSEAEREVGDDRSAATAARAQQIAQRTGEIWPFSTA